MAVLLCRAAREWKTIRILSEVWVTDSVAAGRAIPEAPYLVRIPEPAMTPHETPLPQHESTHQEHARLQHQTSLGAGQGELRRTGAQLQQQQPGRGLPPQRPGSATHPATGQPAAGEAPASASGQHDHELAVADAGTQKHVSKIPEMGG